MIYTKRTQPQPAQKTTRDDYPRVGGEEGVKDGLVTHSFKVTSSSGMM